MRGAAIPVVATSLLLGGCSDWLPPKPVRVAYDFASRQLKGYDPYWRCEYQASEAGIPMRMTTPDRECYSWAPVRHFRGIYIDEFEGQRFLENAKPALKYAPSDNVWLEIDKQSDVSGAPEIAGKPDGKTRVWLVSFIGRKAAASGRYGHMGMSHDEVLVDRVLQARLINTYDGYLPKNALDRDSASSDNLH